MLRHYTDSRKYSNSKIHIVRKRVYLHSKCRNTILTTQHGANSNVKKTELELATFRYT